jgi:hypothetical protein
VGAEARRAVRSGGAPCVPDIFNSTPCFVIPEQAVIMIILTGIFPALWPDSLRCVVSRVAFAY